MEANLTLKENSNGYGDKYNNFREALQDFLHYIVFDESFEIEPSNLEIIKVSVI
jgi:hypothetical protein